MASIIKVDQIQSDQGFVNVSSNLQFSSGFTMLSPTIATPTFTGQATIPTINLTGGQIVFPASQNASSDGNTLDDYEEGSFTPAFINGTFTYGNRNGKYVKIGKLVTVSGLIQWSAKSGSGDVGINLPFSAINESSYRFTGSLGYTNGLDITGLFAIWTGSGSSSQVFIYNVVDQTASFTTTVTNMSSSGELQFSFAYVTD